MKKENIGIIQILVASLLFGFIPVLVRLTQVIDAYNLAFFRVVVASMTIGLFFIFTKSILKPLKKEFGKLLFFGAIHGFIIIGYFIAIKYISVASAVLLLYSSSIWMIIFARIILHEHITKRCWIALLVAFSGLILILSPKSLLLNVNLIGSLSGLLAGVGFGLIYVLSKTFKHYDKVSLTFWQNMIAIPFLLPLFFFIKPQLPQSDLIVVILIGSLFTALPFILVFKGFEKVAAHKGAILVLLDVIFPILFALVLFREVPAMNVMVGGLLIIFGSYLSTTEKK